MLNAVWTSLEHLPEVPYRQRTSRVLIDLVPSVVSNNRVNEVTFKFSEPWMMVAFEPFEFREALGSNRHKPAFFSNRAHYLPGGIALSSQLMERRPEFIAIHMDSEFARSTLESQLQGAPLREEALIRNARPSLLTLCKILRNQMLEQRGLSALQLESFVVLCLSEWAEDLKDGAPPSLRGGLKKEALARIDEFIRANIDQDIALSDLAATVDLSPSYFLRAFKQTTGRTPFRHVMEQRVYRACEHLRDSGLSLSEISLSCGFASQSHMSDAFKRHMDISPGRYRKAHRAPWVLGIETPSKAMQ